MKISLCGMWLALVLGSLDAQEPAAKAPASQQAFAAAGDKLLTKLEEFAKVLETATDKASAEVAKAKLVKLNKEIEALSKAAAALGEPSPEIKAAMEKDTATQLRAENFMSKWVTASRRIGTTPELLEILHSTMRDFQRVSQPPQAPKK